MARRTIGVVEGERVVVDSPIVVTTRHVLTQPQDVYSGIVSVADYVLANDLRDGMATFNTDGVEVKVSLRDFGSRYSMRATKL